MRFILVAAVASPGGLTSGAKTSIISRALLLIKSDITSSKRMQGVIS